jgi:hypothetical protein
MNTPTQHRSEGTQSAKRILAGAPIAPQRTRAITTPRTSVQGMGTAVRIERRKGERVQGQWAEGVPFRHLAELRRVEPATSTTPEPLLMRSEGADFTDCLKTAGRCLGHPDCGSTWCLNHPDNDEAGSAEQAAFDLRGQDYSDHHGPRPMPGELSTRAKFWRCYLGGMALALAAGAWLIF